MPCEHGAIYAVRAIYPLGADAICCKFCEFATREGRPLPYGRETLHNGRGDSRIARTVGCDMPCEHGAIYAVRAI